MVSSWKELISPTVTVSPEVFRHSEVYGFPIFPTTNTFSPPLWAFMISPNRVVVVVLPLVPVMPTSEKSAEGWS